jgi:hypothetical protein
MILIGSDSLVNYIYSAKPALLKSDQSFGATLATIDWLWPSPSGDFFFI